MEWTRHGTCNDCGYCCDYVGDRLHEVTLAHVGDPEYLRVRGYVMLSNVAHLRVHMRATCPELQWERDASRCAIYDERPETCKNFPSDPRQIVHTPCSYYFSTPHERGTHVAGGQGSPYPGSKVLGEPL